MPNAIIFNAINVNANERNGAVFVGETNAIGWESHNKNQMSVGMVFTAYAAGTFFPGNLNLLSDNDFIDTFIQDGFEVEGGPTAQA
jgi:hypothetical protein